MHELVIRGGTVADGLGGSPFAADVAVDAGRISAVGTVSDRGQREVDAGGLLVTPGFVDIHTHYDGQATWEARLVPSSCHGVTTVVMGNCGVGFAPVRPDDHDRLVELMEGVEDIPGTALHQGLDWSWSSFPEYLDVLDARPHDVDLCAQVPHGALRLFVMGERAHEDSTTDDQAQMRRLVAEAVRAGAVGVSTSRTGNHRTATGQPTPSLDASPAELHAIAAGLADAGAGVLELITDFHAGVAEELSLFEDLVRTSGRPMSLSVSQNHRRPEGWRRMLAWVAARSAEGLPVRAQVAPRPVGVLQGLTASTTPFSRHPAWRRLAGLPLDELVAATQDPALRDALADHDVDWARIFPLGDPPDYEPPSSASLAAMASRGRRAPHEVALDLLAEDGGRAFLFAPFANYADGHLDACGEMLAHPDAVLGLGDGGAHVGSISDASFPTYALSHWGRDRDRGRLPIGLLVNQLTRRPAETVGLLDRGAIAVGMKADLNVIDHDRLRCERPTMAYDLPAGGKRLLQRATGYVATFVGGVAIAEHDDPTGALPGRLVRGAQPGQI